MGEAWQRLSDKKAGASAELFRNEGRHFARLLDVCGGVDPYLPFERQVQQSRVVLEPEQYLAQKLVHVS